jgi:cell division protein ZapA
VKEAVQVTLLGQVFSLRSEATPEEVRRVTEFVNRAIAEASSSGKTVDSLNVSLLALLNVAQAFLRLQESKAEEERELVGRLDRLMQRM